MSKQFRIEFTNPDYPALLLPAQSLLADALNDANSPIHFGCKNGLCATCLVSIEALGDSALQAPDANEADVLEIFAPNQPTTRLACRVRLTCDMRINAEC